MTWIVRQTRIISKCIDKLASCTIVQWNFFLFSVGNSNFGGGRRRPRCRLRPGEWVWW